MRELLRANDPVLLSAVGALLDGAGIPHLVLDQNMSIMEGSLGIIARRMLVHDEDMRAARRVMEDAGLGHELRPDTEVTEDAALGGRIRLRQPRKGHRFGHDAILLAAATDARAGDRVVDFGAGVGAAGIALAARLPNIRVTLAENDSALAGLAEENIRLNQLSDRVNAVQVDVTSAWALSASGLNAETVAGVMMNPPFNDPAVHRASPDAARARAHVAQADTLATWIGAAQGLLVAGGTLTMIWRADGVDELLARLESAMFGGVRVMPVYPKPDAAAIRVLVCTRKDSRAPAVTLPGLTLNDADNRPSAAAEAVLREGEALPFGAS